MSNVTLEPFEWVELDQDFCTRTYGSAPCAATLATGGAECYNTRPSCQDPANYEKGALTLRFCKSRAFLPDDAYYIPSMVDARTDAGSINPVGAGSNSTALGTRGGLTVTFQDHPHTDKYVDPYIADRRARDPAYIATERGTFWTKWRARNAYYVGRQIRHKTGFIDPVTRTVVDVVTRTYFVTSFSGPDGSGRVTIQAKDLLSQLANDKAKAPMASRGRLLNDITDVQTGVVLDPVGIGNEEYPVTGVVRIGSELCTFTRSGDNMTLVRARFNTEAKAAKAGDVVQLCLQYTAQRPADILYDLTANYGGIPPANLDTTQWNSEQTDYMPRLYGALITEPTGVLDLINEMCQQMYFYPIWDERTAKLKIRAIRPSNPDEVRPLDDFSNLLEESVELRDLPDQLVTQVWVYYGIINPAANLSDPNNYAVREIVATDEGLPEKNGFEKIKKIFCRWIPSTNGAAAVDIGEKMIARYGAAPRQASFALSEKDKSLWLGDFVQVSNRLSVDMSGAPRALNMQIMSAQQDKEGMLFRYSCQEFIYEKPLDPNNRLIIIAADQINVNLRELHDSLYVPPVGGETINVVIRSGVVIGSRGLETNESYTGQVRFEKNGTVSFQDRTLHPVMRRELGISNVSNGGLVARGAQVAVDPATNVFVPVFTPGSLMYEMQSAMRERPCSYALDTGLWPEGVTLNVLQEAGSYVVGQGGHSSQHTGLGGGSAFGVQGRGGLLIASDGGHALRIRHPVSWTNNGTISGGGAGGFPGLINMLFSTGFVQYYVFSPHESGAGAGRVNTAVSTHASFDFHVVRTAASAGDLTNGGYASVVDESVSVNVFRSNGGDGGDLAQAGGEGTYTRIFANGGSWTNYARRKVGGRPGYAVVEGASLITWVSKGDVRGQEIA